MCSWRKFVVNILIVCYLYTFKSSFLASLVCRNYKGDILSKSIVSNDDEIPGIFLTFADWPLLTGLCWLAFANRPLLISARMMLYTQPIHIFISSRDYKHYSLYFEHFIYIFAFLIKVIAQILLKIGILKGFNTCHYTV